MKVATWNVNGIRARAAQLDEWLLAAHPDVVCLQELKATPAQIPPQLVDHPDYHCYWHGAGAYSGVALLISRARWPERPAFAHPDFDRETRVVTVDLPEATIASIYVPNGGKDYPAKLAFFDALIGWAGAATRPLILCGDLNIARSDLDVHVKERKPVVGQLPEERGRFAALLAHGLTDVARSLAPDDDSIYTWWAPWRSMRQRNIGWRIDYILASTALRPLACTSHREVGTSDHAPLVASFAP
jgi:exodeoxyribonuclease III